MACQKPSHIFTKIAFKPLRTNLFYIVLSVYFLTIGSANLYSQELPKKNKPFPSKNQTTKQENEPESANLKPLTVETKIDTIKVDSIKKMKTFLDGKVRYKAKKSAKFNQKKKIITLNDEAELYYQDFELKAGVIVFDYEKEEVYAGRLKDSTGKFIQYPVFKQGTNEVEPDSIRFNYKTKKALVWNSRTLQSELYIKAEISKKENDSVYFMKNARITTSKNLEDPEYYFLARRVKFVPGKKWLLVLQTCILLMFQHL